MLGRQAMKNAQQLLVTRGMPTEVQRCHHILLSD